MTVDLLGLKSKWKLLLLCIVPVCRLDKETRLVLICIKQPINSIEAKTSELLEDINIV